MGLLTSICYEIQLRGHWLARMLKGIKHFLSIGRDITRVGVNNSYQLWVCRVKYVHFNTSLSLLSYSLWYKTHWQIHHHNFTVGKAEARHQGKESLGTRTPWSKRLAVRGHTLKYSAMWAEWSSFYGQGSSHFESNILRVNSGTVFTVLPQLYLCIFTFHYSEFTNNQLCFKFCIYHFWPLEIFAEIVFYFPARNAKIMKEMTKNNLEEEKENENKKTSLFCGSILVFQSSKMLRRKVT